MPQKIIWLHLKGILITIARSSRSQMYFKIGALKRFHNIHRKTPVLESLFNNVAGLQSYDFIKKRLKHRCFPINIAKFLRTVFFLKNTSGGCFCNKQTKKLFILCFI